MSDTIHDHETDLYRPFALDKVPSGFPRRVEVTATDEECAALAKRFGDVSIAYLKGEFELMLSEIKTDKGLVIVDISGKINANVTQNCVVTSEPVDSIIQAQFEGIVATTEADQPEQTMDDNDEAEDGPELLGLIDGDTIDLGFILAEQLALELDPFPRKPGVSFDGYRSGDASDEEDEKPNPFAVLAKLKDNRE
jgi:uncharacterized metal-binding protein YceD (DUF177 family)